MNETNWPLLLGVITVIFGGVGVLGVVQIGILRSYQRRGRRADGQVIQVIRHRDHGGRQAEYRPDSYTVVVGYRVGGKDFEITVPLDTNPPFYTEGKRVPVYYFSERPDLGRVVCFREYAKWLILSGACLSAVIVMFLIWRQVE